MAAVGFIPALSFAQAQQGGRLVLVMPFRNLGTQPNLDWISASFPSVLNQRLTSAGFLPISREDRLYAFDRLGLPSSLQPSRAMTLRIAQEMDADFVINGTYNADTGRILVEARVLNVHDLSLSDTLRESDELTQLLHVENSLGWQAIRNMEPGYSLDKAAFLAAAPQIRLDAFENYVRGVLATSLPEKIKRFEAALQQSPNDVPTIFQLGRAYFASQEYERAVSMFKPVPSDHPLALQSAFYLGLAQFYTGHYAEAEQSFAFISTRLPLPEVINNRGVAASRHGSSGLGQFQQASTADPKDPDYHYNLAVALRRAGDMAGATREVDAALELRPNDTEARDLKALVARGSRPPSANNDTTGEPLERIKREFNETAVRQAAFAMEQLEQARISSEPAASRSTTESQHGESFLSQGLTLEAEQDFQNAVAADPKNWQAHAGLAAVRARTGDSDGALAEAALSLQIKPNAQAYAARAAAQLSQKKLPESAASVTEALRLEPGNIPAQQIKAALRARGVSVP